MHISLNILTWKSPLFPNQSNTELLNRTAVKIGILAVGIFSAYTNYRLFVPWFCGGVLIGGYNKYFEEKVSNSSEENDNNNNRSSGYSTGWLETGLGIKVPTLLALGIIVAKTIEHIDHHPRVDVPATSLILGYWLGQYSLSHFFSRKWTPITTTAAPSGCCPH
jgi:hypothetical protein